MNLKKTLIALEASIEDNIIIRASGPMAISNIRGHFFRETLKKSHEGPVIILVMWNQKIIEQREHEQLHLK